MNFALCVVCHPDKERFALVHEKEERGWWLPGGGVDAKQLFSEAGVREVQEEAGLDVELTGVLRVEHSIARCRVIFQAKPRNPSATPKQQPDAESKGARYVTMQQLKDIRDGKDPFKTGNSWLRGPEPLQWFRWCLTGPDVATLDSLSLYRYGSPPLDTDPPIRTCYKTLRQISLVVLHPCEEGKILSRVSNNTVELPCVHGHQHESFVEAGVRCAGTNVDLVGVAHIAHALNVESMDQSAHSATMRVTFVGVAKRASLLCTEKRFHTPSPDHNSNRNEWVWVDMDEFVRVSSANSPVEGHKQIQYKGRSFRIPPFHAKEILRLASARHRRPLSFLTTDERSDVEGGVGNSKCYHEKKLPPSVEDMLKEVQRTATMEKVTACKYMEVIKPGDLRAGHSSGALQIGRLHVGQRVRIFERFLDGSGREWLRIDVASPQSLEVWTALTKKDGSLKLRECGIVG